MKSDEINAMQKLLADSKVENSILKSSLLEVIYVRIAQKQKQDEAVQEELSELRTRTAKLEEDLELANYHNQRLTKRVSQLMEQLKNSV